MKSLLKITIITASAAAWLLGSQALQAAEPDVTLPKYTIEEIAVMPQPTHDNLIPSIGREYVGFDLRLKLTVNEKGQADQVRLERPLISYSDIEKMTFASQMRDLVAGWTFSPAENIDGDAIALQVIMPIKVVEKATGPSLITAVVLDSPKDKES